jgi:hypothetical protein
MTDFIVYAEQGAAIGLGIWFTVYLSNRVWLMFKGIVS